MTTPRRALIIFTLHAACFGGVASAQPSGGPPAATVRVAHAAIEQAEQRSIVTGSVRAWRESRLAAREPGRVLTMDVREGDFVEAGQTIATLDDTILRIELDAAQAALRGARAALAERSASLEKSERDLARLTSLLASRSASQNEYDDGLTVAERTRALRDQAEADVENATANVARLVSRLYDMRIVAPFNGRVAARLIEIGEWAAVGAPIARLIATDRVDVWLDVPQYFIESAAAPGATVTFDVPALGESFEAPVAGVLPIADDAARTFPVRATFERDDERLRPGMNVIGYVRTGDAAPTLIVPRDAMLRDDAGWFVYTATGDAADALAAIPARVEQLFGVGAERVAVRVITGPLFPGALVVVEGNERILFPGQPLRLANPDAFGAANTERAAR